MMKKFTPYVFPLVALLVVIFLLYRWYDMRTEKVVNPVEFGEGVEIENLSENELGSVLRGSNDITTVELENAQTDSAEPASTGVIRYDVVDNKVLFSVMAELPELEQGAYQVWLKEINGDGMRKAFSLEAGKGGMMGSASVSTELLPFEVVVSKEMSVSDETIETVILKGAIERPVEASTSPSPAMEQ